MNVALEEELSHLFEKRTKHHELPVYVFVFPIMQLTKLFHLVCPNPFLVNTHNSSRISIPLNKYAGSY